MTNLRGWNSVDLCRKVSPHNSGETWPCGSLGDQIQSVSKRRQLQALLAFVTERVRYPHPRTSDSLTEPGRQVDIETSRHEGRIVACQGYDDTLDELNSRLEGMSDRYSSPDVVWLTQV